jgi:hypothetical protein
MPAAILRDSAPESRTTPMPDLPGGVEIATIVSSRFNGKQAQARTAALQIYFFGRNERFRQAATNPCGSRCGTGLPACVAFGIAANEPRTWFEFHTGPRPSHTDRTILTRLRLAAQ